MCAKTLLLYQMKSEYNIFIICHPIKFLMVFLFKFSVIKFIRFFFPKLIHRKNHSVLSTTNNSLETTTSTAASSGNMTSSNLFDPAQGNLQATSNNKRDSSLEYSEILEELDWCLTQLEHMQSHKTISDIASTKVITYFVIIRFVLIR